MHTLLNIVIANESKRPHDNMLPLYNKIPFLKICYPHIFDEKGQGIIRICSHDVKIWYIFYKLIIIRKTLRVMGLQGKHMVGWTKKWQNSLIWKSNSFVFFSLILFFVIK
jgi:hypothetical protein